MMATQPEPSQPAEPTQPPPEIGPPGGDVDVPAPGPTPDVPITPTY